MAGSSRKWVECEVASIGGLREVCGGGGGSVWEEGKLRGRVNMAFYLYCF